MTSLLKILNHTGNAQSIVSCLSPKEVFPLRSLGRSMKDPITKAFESDREVTVAHAKLMRRLGLGEPVRHRGVGPNEIEISVEFVNGVAVVPHDIMLYVPPPPPQGDAAAVELGRDCDARGGHTSAAAAGILRHLNPAGRNAGLTEDEFVRRVADLVAPGARMSIPALEGAYEEKFETSMIKDSTVLSSRKDDRIKKLVKSIAEYGVSACQSDIRLTLPLPNGWKKWTLRQQRSHLRLYREK